MIIYKDKEGRENIIRSDELIEKLIKENIITENTLLKTEVAGDWIAASEFELFKKHNKIIEKIDDTPALIKDMQSDYNEALKDPIKINLFKDKWKAVSVIINDEDNKKLNESNGKFSTSNIWMVKINTTIRILLGRNIHSNLAAFLADNNRAIKENLSGLFEIQDSNELNIIKHPLLENKNNQITISNKGILGLPNPKNKLPDEKNEILSKKVKEKNIDKIINDKFYVPKKINKKIDDGVKKEELQKSVPTSQSDKTKTQNIKIKKMGFVEAIKTCFKKYFDFSGRARRSEYWYFLLLNLIALFGFLLAGLPDFYGIFYLTVLIPSLSVTIRRLHDIGKSGVWFFISFIPIVGGLLILIFVLMDSQPTRNKYGKNPKI